MQNPDKPLESILSPLEFAICMIVEDHPGINTADIIHQIQSGAYQNIGVTTGHYSRVSATIRKLTLSPARLERWTAKREEGKRGRTSYLYRLTPQGEAAVRNTEEYRKAIDTQPKE